MKEVETIQLVLMEKGDLDRSRAHQEGPWEKPENIPGDASWCLCSLISCLPGPIFIGKKELPLS